MQHVPDYSSSSAPSYPHEHGRRRNGGFGWEPLVLYDTEKGPAPRKHCYWSDYCEAASAVCCPCSCWAACLRMDVDVWSGGCCGKAATDSSVDSERRGPCAF